MLNKRVVANADLRPAGYKILLEILMEGKFKNIAEVVYTFSTKGRGESRLNARQQLDYLKHIYSLMRRKGELLRFAKFCLVGFNGVLISVGLLWLLTEYAGLFYLLSAAISIEFSIVSIFVLNDCVTFPDRRSPTVKSFLNRLLKYNSVCGAGLVSTWQYSGYLLKPSVYTTLSLSWVE